MRDRKGDWRDLLSAYALALDAKKIYLGFVAVFLTALIVILAAVLYERIFGPQSLSGLGNFTSESSIMRCLFLRGEPAADLLPEETGAAGALVSEKGLAGLKGFLPVLNPFRGGVQHFCFSIIFYVALMWAWSYFGGVISRLAALEYARDDLPTLRDASEMVKSKRRAYLMAPLSPIIGVVLFSLAHAVAGLVNSIPYAGPILMVPGYVVAVFSAIIIVFIVVFGVLSFGLMLPSISIGGKDAFEGWSSAYSYLLWGLNRFIGYTVVVAAVGVLAFGAALGLSELLIYCLVKTVGFGLISAPVQACFDSIRAGAYDKAIWDSFQYGKLYVVGSTWLALVVVIVRMLPCAYLFAYFFTANTLICFLMRKNVDKIELDEVYEEAPEEKEAAGEGLREEAEEGKEPESAEKEAEAEGAAEEVPEGETEAPESDDQEQAEQ